MSIIVHKFGRNDNVGTTAVPVAVGGVYRTPQSATALRVKAGDANDTAAGSGAREITIQGLDENFDFASEAVATAGASAGSPTTTTFTRVYRAFVSKSGTYATTSQGSHAAAITIEDAAGTEDWLTIDATGFPAGQSDIGVYSVADGFYAYINTIYCYVASNKTATITGFRREKIDQTSAPYEAMRAFVELGSVSGGEGIILKQPLGPFKGPCDIGFMARVASTTASVSVDFEIEVFSASSPRVKQ